MTPCPYRLKTSKANLCRAANVAVHCISKNMVKSKQDFWSSCSDSELQCLLIRPQRKYLFSVLMFKENF